MVKAWIWISLVIVLLGTGIWFGGDLFSIIQDHYSIYDDFEGGFRDDLWTVTSHSLDNIVLPNQYITNPSLLVKVENGELYTFLGAADSSSLVKSDSIGRVAPRVSSTRLFTTEDIKFKVNRGSTTNGFCSSDGQVRSLNVVCLGSDCVSTLYEPTGTNNGGCWSNVKNSAVIFEIRRYDDFDPSKYVWIIAGKEIRTGSNTEPVSLTIDGGTAYFEYVRYQPYFSCEIDYDTEVVVRDNFGVGSDIVIDDLTYVATKFCPQDLGALIFSEVGLTDEKGSLTETLAQGEMIRIREDCTGIDNCVEAAILSFDYITKYVTDMTERCGVGQVYDTDEKACLQIAGQQIQTETLLICNTDSNCGIPSNCPGTTVSCVDSRCEYNSPSCTDEQLINNILVQKTLDLSDPTITTVGDGIITANFNAPKTVLGQPFLINSISPLTIKSECRVEDGYLSPSKEGCYEVEFEWGNYLFTIENGGEKKLDGNFHVQFDMGGLGVFNGNNGEKDFNYEFVGSADDYQIQIDLTMTDLIGFNVNEYSERALLNGDYKIKLDMTNNIFTVVDSGYNIKVKKDIRTVEERLPPVKVSYKPGTATHTVSLPSDELGIFRAEIIPYMRVFDGLDYLGSKLDISYFIESELSTCIETGCVVGDCVKGECIVTDEEVVGDVPDDIEPTIFEPTVDLSIGWIIAILIIIVLVVGIIIFIARRK